MRGDPWGDGGGWIEERRRSGYDFFIYLFTAWLMMPGYAWRIAFLGRHD